MKKLNKQIIIYHLNDDHARVSTNDDDKKAIGLDKISKLVNLTLLNNKNTFLFHAGDCLHGLPRANISQGENIVKLLNPTHLNALCPGNHEWNMGYEQLCKLSKKLKAYILCANIVDKVTKSFIFPPYIIYDVDLNQDDYISENSNTSTKDNIKIGVFGLATPETAYKTHPDNVKNVEFLNPIIAAKNIINTLSNTCDIIIALTHLGLDNSSEFTSKILAEQVNNIDIIIDGHSHTKLEHGLKINNTLIVQAECHQHFLGKIILDIENKKIKNINAELLNEDQIDNLIKQPDTYISNKLNQIDNEINQLLNKPLFVNTKELSGDRLLVRRQESELGNLVANACRYYTNADISITNGGDIRASLLAKTITYKDILSIFPFQNTINTYEILGSIIKEMFEHSIEFTPASFGGFLSVSSNVKIICNLNNPPKQRVQQIYINNQLLDNNNIYIISMTNFIAAGGDDYSMLKDLKLVNTYDTLEKILINYFTQKGINEEDYKLGNLIIKD